MLCNGFPEICAWLEEGGWGQSGNGYMCIVLYLQVWCNGLQGIYAVHWLGVNQSLIHATPLHLSPANIS